MRGGIFLFFPWKDRNKSPIRKTGWNGFHPVSRSHRKKNLAAGTACPLDYTTVTATPTAKNSNHPTAPSAHANIYLLQGELLEVTGKSRFFFPGLKGFYLLIFRFSSGRMGSVLGCKKVVGRGGPSEGREHVDVTCSFGAGLEI